MNSNNVDGEWLQAQINKRLKVAYELARAGTGTEEGRKAIDFFYSVHLNSYPGFAHDLLAQAYKKGYEDGKPQHPERNV